MTALTGWNSPATATLLAALVVCLFTGPTQTMGQGTGPRANTVEGLPSMILSSGWQLQDIVKVPDSGQVISQPAYSPSQWHKATVPGTVLTSLVNDVSTAPMLQESLITQRNGRYVLPLRAEFKGRMKSIVHDQSASGATLFVEPLVIVELNNRWR